MSHTRRAHPALRVVGEVISEHIISEVLLDEKRRTHVVVGDHAPEPRVVHEYRDAITGLMCTTDADGYQRVVSQEDRNFLDRNRWRL